MKELEKSLKAHIANYRLFYVSFMISIYPIWNQIKISSLLISNRLSLFNWLVGYDIIIFFVIIAVSLKTKSALISKLILVLTLIIHIFLIWALYKYILSDLIIFVLFLIYFLAYIFWGMIYFLIDETYLTIKQLTIKGKVFFIIMFIMFYITKYFPLALTNYQTSIISQASGFIVNIWAPIVISLFIVLILFVIFLYSHNMARKSFYKNSTLA